MSKNLGSKAPNHRDLDALGLEPYTMLNFRVHQLRDRQTFDVFFKSRQLPYIRPLYPETRLGTFKCGCPGGADHNGDPVILSLGCPVHTPTQSWPITDALIEWVGQQQRKTANETDTLIASSNRSEVSHQPEVTRFSLLEID